MSQDDLASIRAIAERMKAQEQARIDKTGKHDQAGEWVKSVSILGVYSFDVVSTLQYVSEIRMVHHAVPWSSMVHSDTPWT